MQVFFIVAVSVLAAISYGILHDQITARICIEYFTIGHPRLIESDSPTILALFWGVAATWWMGLPLGLGLAVAARAGRRPKLGVAQIRRPLITLLCWMFGIAFVAGLIGFLTARAGVFRLASRIPDHKHVAFLTVGWAHSASYLSGILGGITLWIAVWRSRRVVAERWRSGA